MRDERLTRRRYVALIGVGAAAGLAGCSDGTEGEAGPDSGETSRSEDDGSEERNNETETEGATETADNEQSLGRGTPWPEFGADGRNSGSREGGPNLTDDSEELWRFQTQRSRTEIATAPVVAGGTVYVGTDDATLYALSADDGTEQWTATGTTTPAVVDGTVFVASTGASITALSSEDGTEQWRYETDTYGIESAPTVVDGTVYVVDMEQSVHAISVDDGSEQWRFDASGPAAPAVADGTVYTATTEGVYAISAADGTEQWYRDVNLGRARSAPTVVDGTVYVGSEGGIVGGIIALSTDDGSTEWAYEPAGTGPQVVGSVAVDGDTVYAGVTGDEPRVYALSAESGDKRWDFGDFELDDSYSKAQLRSSPAVSGDTVYAGSDDGYLYALSTEDGSERWSFEAGSPVQRSVAAVDGAIYVGDTGGNVYALGEN